jgi:hypothetical protein
MKYKARCTSCQFVPNRKVSINSKKLAKIINGTTFIASHELSGIISSLKDRQKTITDNNINDPKMTKYLSPSHKRLRFIIRMAERKVQF